MDLHVAPETPLKIAFAILYLDLKTYKSGAPTPWNLPKTCELFGFNKDDQARFNRTFPARGLKSVLTCKNDDIHDAGLDLCDVQNMTHFVNTFEVAIESFRVEDAKLYTHLVDVSTKEFSWDVVKRTYVANNTLGGARAFETYFAWLWKRGGAPSRVDFVMEALDAMPWQMAGRLTFEVPLPLVSLKHDTSLFHLLMPSSSL